MRDDERKKENILNQEAEVTPTVLEQYLRFIRAEAQEQAKKRAADIFRKYPDVKNIERRLQEAYRERIIKGSKGGVATRAEYDKMIEDLKVRKQKLLDEAGLVSDYLEPS